MTTMTLPPHTEQRKALSNRAVTVTKPSRVVTLTPAPAIDRVYFLDRLQEGQVNRASRVESYLAGKGVNVARALQLSGNPTSAVIPINSADFEVGVDQGLKAQQLFKAVSVPGSIRVNAIVVDIEGATTNFNESAAPLTGDEWSRLCELTLHESWRLQADWLVLGGSLPLNSSTGREVDPQPLFNAAKAADIFVCLDTAGTALQTWAHADSPLDLIKPNVAELAEVTGTRLRTLRDVEKAARILRQRGVRTVLASLGADGILEVSQAGSLWARGPSARVLNTTGAGDAALAGYLSALPHKSRHPHDRSISTEALKRAVSWGSLAVQQATTILPRIETNSSGITITTPDPDFVLSS
jgi:1-phosphofructokinase